jgi:uncharacterized RDD family membrane protein YckC
VIDGGIAIRRVIAFLVDVVGLTCVAVAASAAASADLSSPDPLLAGLVWLLLSTTYFTATHGSHGGASVGKALFGIRVAPVRPSHGEQLGYIRALVRWLVVLVFLTLGAILFFIDCFVGLLNPDGRTIHDRVTGSRVERRTRG